MIYRRTLQTCKDGPCEKIGATGLFDNLFPHWYGRCFFAIQYDGRSREPDCAERQAGAQFAQPGASHSAAGADGQGSQTGPEDHSTSGPVARATRDVFGRGGPVTRQQVPDGELGGNFRVNDR